jgi:hypothetical protein
MHIAEMPERGLGHACYCPVNLGLKPADTYASKTAAAQQAATAAMTKH